MKPLSQLPRILTTPALLAFAILNSQLSTALAQGTTAFTYQGRLNTGTNRANGGYDLSFAVYDANVAGNLIAGPITNSAVAVSNGLFTVTLDFGPGVFTGTNYWVQMAVSPAGAGTFATLVPRQQLTPAPYALSLVSPQATALCPPGSIMAFGGTNIPNGWFLCNGTNVSRTTYTNLFAAIGTAWGAGDGSTSFNLPDMRGVFLRGVDNGAGNDPDTARRIAPPLSTGGNSGDAVGSFQTDQLAGHRHDNGSLTSGNSSALGGYELYGQAGSGSVLSPIASWAGISSVSGWTSTVGGSETRPRNVYVNYIIKY